MCFEREVEEKDAGLWLVGRVLDGKAFLKSPSSLSIIGFRPGAKRCMGGGGERSVQADFCCVRGGVLFERWGALALECLEKGSTPDNFLFLNLLRA
jgi:hypothetical protein